jgi:dihydroneopterin aldolase
VAERIATAILKHREVSQVTIRVSKRPPLPKLNTFTVEITRPAD